MDINTSMNAGGINGLIPARRSAPGVKTIGDNNKTSFTSSAALDTALQGVPDSRSEAVDRARSLINDPDYPSADTIHQISNLLADKLTSADD